MKYKIGFYQFMPEHLNISANLNKIETALEKVKADLIVLPELSVSGYMFNNKEEVAQMAEDAQNGVTATLMKKIAKEKNMSIVIGFVEKSLGKYYNSSMLVNPDGEIQTYRKIHLFYEEKLFFEKGNLGFRVFKAKNNIPVGLMICFDWLFPESARTLSLKGASIICHSANLVLPWCQQAMITRSLENKIYSITANRYGKESNQKEELIFTGKSQILGVRGEILHKAPEQKDDCYITEIETDFAQDKSITEYNDLFLDRQIKYYFENE